MATEQHPCEAVPEHDGGADDRDDAGAGRRRRNGPRYRRRPCSSSTTTDAVTVIAVTSSAFARWAMPRTPRRASVTHHERARLLTRPRATRRSEAGERGRRMGGPMDVWREWREVALELGQASLTRRDRALTTATAPLTATNTPNRRASVRSLHTPAPRGSRRRNVAARTASRGTRRPVHGGTTTRAARR